MCGARERRPRVVSNSMSLSTRRFPMRNPLRRNKARWTRDRRRAVVSLIGTSQRAEPERLDPCGFGRSPLGRSRRLLHTRGVHRAVTMCGARPYRGDHVHQLLRPSRLARSDFGAESIRELVFGIEDGVVQNMTLVAGMVGASLSNRVIVVAAAINAIAGVLSMSMGTYLSSKAERDVAMAPGRVRGVPERAAAHAPSKDAAVMAGAYAVGALVPLVPFAVGLGGRGSALAVAVVLTGLTLFALGVGKAIVSEQRRLRSGLEMLFLASAAGLGGYMIGVAAGEIFELDL